MNAAIGRAPLADRGNQPPARKRILLASLSGQLGGMEMRFADEARFLASLDATALLAMSRFPGRDAWLDDVAREHPAFERCEFDPPPFFDEWRWHKLRFAWAKLSWPARLRRQRIALAHVFYAWTLYGGSRLWLCHQAGIPAVLSVHNCFPRAELTPWQQRIAMASFSSVRGIYAVSQSALDHFLTTYEPFIRPATRLDVIPNFVDIRRYLPSPERRHAVRTALGIPEDASVVGSIGRLDTQKEPLTLLEVFRRVVAARPDTHLVFCGQGPLSEATQAEACRHPWRGQVHFLGFRRDTEAVMAALDLHLLLSRQEGFGITNAEAMACGIPSVATNVPGTRDAFAGSNAAELVQYGDTPAVADAVVRLLADDSRRWAMGEAGRAHVIRHFSRECWANRLNRFYSHTAPEFFAEPASPVAVDSVGPWN